MKQGSAREQGFGLGIEPVGPLPLSIPSTLRGHPPAAQSVRAGMLQAVPPHGTWREVVRGEFALRNDAQYTVDLFSVSHLTRCLGVDADSGEAIVMLVPHQCV